MISTAVSAATTGAVQRAGEDQGGESDRDDPDIRAFLEPSSRRQRWQLVHLLGLLTNPHWLSRL